jgi:Zn-finger nucleic acid-binding protein
MKCPKCDVLLNEITRAGVLVDMCEKCLGMWLERGELEKIAGRLRELERDWDDDVRYSRGRERDDDRPRYEDRPRHDDDRRHDDPRAYPKRKRWSDLFDIFD